MPGRAGRGSRRARGDRGRRRLARRDRGRRPRARARGSSPGAERAGWVGKPWALQQGLEAATRRGRRRRSTPTRARGAGSSARSPSALDDADLVTASARFVCDGPGERLLHPSMLASLVYRYGPADADGAGRARPRARQRPGHGRAARARCWPPAATRRPRAHMTDDAALARALARAGWRIAFVDGTALVEVRMYASARETWREWGRSIALPDVTPPAWQAADLAVVWLGDGAAASCAAGGRSPAPARPGAARRAAGAAGAAVAAPTRAAARRSGSRRSRTRPPRVRLTLSALRPRREWRGRVYRARTAARSGTSARPWPSTCSTGSVASWTTGNANTPTRAPHLKPAAARSPRRRARGRSRRRAGRARTPPPTNVITALPPRKPANSGNAWPSIAPGDAGERAPPAGERERRRARRAGPWRRRPRNAGARAPGAELLERVPRARVAVARARRRSTPWRRATSSATGIEPSR